MIGRRTELDLLGGVLSNLDRGSGVTIRLRGEAGFGKTTLLDWVAAQTTAAVVRLTGSESEAELAFSGLAAMLKLFVFFASNCPARTPRCWPTRSAADRLPVS